MWGSGGIAPHMLIFSIRWRRVVSFAPQPCISFHSNFRHFEDVGEYLIWSKWYFNKYNNCCTSNINSWNLMYNCLLGFEGPMTLATVEDNPKSIFQKILSIELWMEAVRVLLL
jgi:hypothetical protein